jgi:hypothetical protein
MASFYGSNFAAIIGIGVFFGIPAWLAMMFIVNIFRKNPKAGNLTDGLTMVLGTADMLLLLDALAYNTEHDEQIWRYNTDIFGMFHTPFASEYRPTLIVFCVVALLSYLLLRYMKKGLPLLELQLKRVVMICH